MADLNKVFLMGRLTADPVLRHTPNGTAVTELRLATNRSWSGREGERKEEALYIDITVWDRQAENCCEYLKKGSSIHVEGSLRMDQWDDKTTGEKRTKIKVHAERVQFLDRRGDPSGGAPDEEFSPPPAREAPSRRPAGAPSYEPRGAAGGAGRGYAAQPAARRPEPETDDEDIPF